MAIKGYGLKGFIQETCIPPEKFKLNENQEPTANPDYNIHQRKDHLIASWLLSSINPSLLPQVIGCKSSLEIWNTIEQVFNSQYSAKILHYKRQLQHIKNDNLGMREYLTKIKNLCDLLAAAGHKIPGNEQVLTILSGLSDEYEPVIVLSSFGEISPSYNLFTPYY